MQFKSFLLAALAAGSAMAHITMKDPPPLRHHLNPYTTDVDYDILDPISTSEYPCKNRTNLIGTPQGQAVKTYAPGEQASMTFEGKATHNGGSCQISLSYDKGKTFTVIKSFIGNCPVIDKLFNFQIPADAPEGSDVLLAWNWLNKTGNREFYMSCAVVNIKGSGGRESFPMANSTNPVSNKTEIRASSILFADRPQVFVANLGGEFCTLERVDIVYPNPGPDVENAATDPGPPTYCASGAKVEGTEGQGAGSGASSASSGSSSVTSTRSGGDAQSSTTATLSTSAVSMNIPSPSTSITSSKPASSTTTSSSSTTVKSTSSTAILTIIPTTKSTSSSGTDVTGTATTISSHTSNSTTTTATVATPPINSGAAEAQKGPCDHEGAWNCIDGGSRFQRCAAGKWSVPIRVALGTECRPGMNGTLNMGYARDRVHRAEDFGH